MQGSQRRQRHHDDDPEVRREGEQVRRALAGNDCPADHHERTRLAGMQRRLEGRPRGTASRARRARRISSRVRGSADRHAGRGRCRVHQEPAEPAGGAADAMETGRLGRPVPARGCRRNEADPAVRYGKTRRVCHERPAQPVRPSSAGGTADEAKRTPPGCRGQGRLPAGPSMWVRPAVDGFCASTRILAVRPEFLCLLIRPAFMCFRERSSRQSTWWRLRRSPATFPALVTISDLLHVRGRARWPAGRGARALRGTGASDRRSSDPPAPRPLPRRGAHASLYAALRWHRGGHDAGGDLIVLRPGHPRLRGSLGLAGWRYAGGCRPGGRVATALHQRRSLAVPLRICGSPETGIGRPAVRLLSCQARPCRTRPLICSPTERPARQPPRRRVDGLEESAAFGFFEDSRNPHSPVWKGYSTNRIGPSVGSTS